MWAILVLELDNKFVGHITTMPSGINSLSRYLLLVFLVLFSEAVFSQGINFTATGELTATPAQLKGRVTLELNANRAIYDVLVFARARAKKELVGDIPYWEAGSQAIFNLNTPSIHKLPGDYHLILEVAFRDENGATLGVAIQLPYQLGGSGDAADHDGGQDGSGTPVSMSLEGDRIYWPQQTEDFEQIRLSLTTEPSWDSSDVYSPPEVRLDLIENGERQAVRNWRYQQLARLEWVQDGRHYSRILNWTLHTDENGAWERTPKVVTPKVVTPTRLKNPVRQWTPALLMIVAAGLFIRLASRSNHKAPLSNRKEEWVGGLVLLALTAWSIAHANPALWLTHTWSTGGDIASQVFYAKIFMEWLPTGKISGWLPESFGGFPAFTFYFPFPFSLAGLLQFAVGQQVAFKLVSMLPAFLLPAATYLMGYSWGWRVPVRLLAAAGATAFIFGGATSIWGGNVLAQLSGEFAYSWGLLFAVLFWAALAPALNKGGRWWLLAAAIEALVALSHGYALLAVGFGAFLYLLVSRNVWYDLRIILKIHVLAFLLIGFWLIPLLENLPWTIPNDGATAVGNWWMLWPKSLWPFMLGWIPLFWILVRPSKEQRYGFLILAGISLLGLLGFLGGGRLGLADLRFFPIAQWALATASGAAVGWTLQHWLDRAALPLAIAASIALCLWWEPLLDQVGDWSAWNLSGYESKAMWPHYLATARVNAGELDGPRLVFEHDPANSDLGSTRSLEALPMFGSRPALEGLYMESAISGPFIYQLQAEISQRPSSPLSRYPASARSIEDAVGHLNELYVDRLILRSREKQALFGADPRFQLIAQHGPLQTYEFTQLQTRLVEVAATPLLSSDRENWLGHAFRRYLVDFPYQQRYVYLAKGEQLPESTSWPGPARVEIKELTRERFVFETNRPGQPHLIRMTYHPRWASTGGETVFLTEPSFMLVYPRNTTVELVYGWGWGDRLGIAFSLSGIALLVWGLWRGSTPRQLTIQPVFQAGRRRFFGFSGAVALVVLLIWLNDPELAYARGHQLVSQQDWVAAAVRFDEALAGRRTAARRSEALFWAARSLDLGGKKQDAGTRYAELRSDYPESYWYPESVYRLIAIHHQNGELDVAETLYAELLEYVPNNRWTRDAANLLGKPGA